VAMHAKQMGATVATCWICNDKDADSGEHMTFPRHRAAEPAGGRTEFRDTHVTNPHLPAVQLYTHAIS
jgi:hypothetical protein